MPVSSYCRTHKPHPEAKSDKDTIKAPACARRKVLLPSFIKSSCLQALRQFKSFYRMNKEILCRYAIV